MPLEDLIITVFCWVDQHLNALLGDCPLHQRGFAPKLTDSEVITMEFPEAANFGYCAAKKQHYYGLHGHLMITVNGVITAWTVTPASGDEREALWDLTNGVLGLVIGDQGYLSAFLQAELATVGIDLQTPLRANMTDPRPSWVVRQLTSTRRLVETVIGQLAEQFHFEKIRARDVWHLTSRIARKVLAHTLGIFMNRQIGRSDLQLEGLIA